MTEKRKRDPEFVTPKGTFVWPKLNEPDTKWKKEGEYTVKLRLRINDKETRDFIAKLETLHAEALAEGQEQFDKLPVAQRKKLKSITVHPLYSEVYDKETEEPTGEIEFKFGMRASGVAKKTGKPWTRKPLIVDSKGNRMENPPAIWGGTIGRVAFSASAMFVSGTGVAGLSYRLSGVKILDLVTAGGGRSAESMGLGGDEGGYEYSAQDALAEDEAKDDAKADDDDGHEDF